MFKNHFFVKNLFNFYIIFKTNIFIIIRTSFILASNN